jgi:phosphohistidine phosphatase
MKTLLVVRHGQAENHLGVDIPDYVRNLTARGQADVLLTAHQVKPYCAAGAHIISSSANRTLQTAQILAAALDIPHIGAERSLYLAEAGDWFAALAALPDHIQTVLLVGHNPGISDLASICSQKSLSLATAGFAVFQTPTDTSWDNAQSWHQVEL